VGLKMIPTIVVKYLIRLSFFMFSFFFPVNKEKITFASYRSEKLEGNLLYVYNELKSRDDHYQTSFLFKKYNSSVFGKLNYVIHMLQASYLLATSRYFIIDDYYFPVYAITPRKGTDIVQLWHAAGAFKKFGFSTIGKSFGPSVVYLRHIKIHSNYTKVYVSSKNVIPHYAEAFDMEADNIFPFGLPRTDFFFKDGVREEVMNKFEQHFPHFKDKKLILYAPTFRGSSHYQENFNIPIDISALRTSIGEEYALIIHLHPYMRAGLMINEEDQDFAGQINGELTIEELLTIADMLVTDYSSIIFDYSLLKRPIAFFVKDLEEYKKERDFYYEFDSFIPGPMFMDTFALAQWINQERHDLNIVDTFTKFFFDYVDGKSSERIVNHLLQESNGEYAVNGD
jgi:CDP-glycerol glycerophosphotransferase (TagB/SpsB family)